MAFEFNCKCPHCENDDFSNEWAVKNEIDLIDDDEVGDVRCSKCGCVFYVETEKELVIRVYVNHSKGKARWLLEYLEYPKAMP